MDSNKFSAKLAVIFLLIIAIPFTLCSCDSIFGAFDKEVTSISLSESEITLTVGDSKMIEAQILPEDASNKSLVWTSSNNEVAVVDDGTITAKKAGAVVIKVEADNGVSKSCNVTVENPEITKITLSDETATLKVGQTIQIEAKITPLDAKDDNLAWSSDADDIARVNTSGYVTGVSAGVASIVCKATNGVESSCTVTVRDAVQPTTSEKASEPSTTEPNDKSKSQSSNSKKSNSSAYKYSGCIFPDSSSRRLTASEVSKLSESEVQQAINEIYARNGNIFKTPSIQQYFEAQPWYVPRGTVNPNDLSDIEQYNISLLVEYK